MHSITCAHQSRCRQASATPESTWLENLHVGMCGTSPDETLPAQSQPAHASKHYVLRVQLQIERLNMLGAHGSLNQQ